MCAVTASERVSQTRSRELSRSVHLAGDNESEGAKTEPPMTQMKAGNFVCVFRGGGDGGAMKVICYCWTYTCNDQLYNTPILQVPVAPRRLGERNLWEGEGVEV